MATLFCLKSSKTLHSLQSKNKVSTMSYSSQCELAPPSPLLHGQQLLPLYFQFHSHGPTYIECAKHSVIAGVCTVQFLTLGNLLQRLLLNYSFKSSKKWHLFSEASPDIYCKIAKGITLPFRRTFTLVSFSTLHHLICHYTYCDDFCLFLHWNVSL